MAACNQLRDQLDHVLDRRAREGLVVGAAEAEPVGVGEVCGGHLARQLLARDPSLAGRGVDLVVYVRDVRYKIDLVTLMDQKSLQQQEHDVRTRVADMDTTVDSGTAGVNAHSARLPRLQRLEPARPRVVQDHFSSQGARTLASDARSARSG